LVLEDVPFAGSVELLRVQRTGDPEEHELRGLVDCGSEVHGDASEVCHLEGNRRLEARIDLRSRDVDRDADPRVAASALDETDQIVRDEDLFMRLGGVAA
jgi:hypothetical protein